MRGKGLAILAWSLAGLAPDAGAGTPQVLYDQTTEFTGFGITTATYVTPTYLIPYNSEGANDFIADYDFGWNVTGFRFVSFGGNAPPTPPPGTARVTIYADVGAQPLANPVCPTTVGAVQYDDATHLAEITLDAPCTVPQARYWVAVSFVTDRDGNGDDPNLAGAWGVLNGTNGLPAMWRNPNGGFPSSCQDWRPLAQCGRDQHGTEFGFQVLGFPNDSGKPAAPAVEADFTPSIVAAGDVTTLTLTLSNGNEVPANTVTDMVNTLPPGLTVADPPNAQTTCANGVVDAAPGAGSFSLQTNTQIPAMASCTVSVSVNASSAGRYVHEVPAGILETDLGNNSVAVSTELNVYGVPDGEGIELTVTLSADPPPACGTATSLDVPAGEPVNFCFTLTNHTNETLNYHTLSFEPLSWIYTADDDSHFFYLKSQPVPPGESWQYNHVLLANAGQMPTFTWTALVGRPTYVADESAAVSFVDIRSFGTPLALSNATAFQMDLPFSLSRYGFAYNEGGSFEFCLYNSGALQFVKYGCPLFDGLYFDNETIDGLSDSQSDALFPFWDYLGDEGEVYYATIGAAPNRQFIVAWYDKNHFSQPGSSDGVTFELILDEATGAVSYVYDDTGFGLISLDGGASATLGMNSYTREFRQQHSYNQPSVTDGSSIIWRPMYVARTASAQTRINVGAPRIAANPGAFNVSAPAGKSVARQLSIGNVGDIDLIWSLDEVAPTAHFPPLRVDSDAGGRAWLDRPLRHEIDAANEFHPYAAPEAGSALSVPAYAVKIEAAPSQHDALVAIDADSPAQFAYLPSSSFPLAGPTPRLGDFVGDDFSRLIMVMEDPLMATNSHLIAVDTATSASELISADVVPQMPDIQWTGTSWDRSSGNLYAVAWTGLDFAVCSLDGQSSTLYAIDPANGTVARIGPIAHADMPVCVADIAIAPNGLMYGIDVYNDALLAIDKTSGQAEFIGPLGFELVEKNAIDFDDETGVLYLAAYQQGQDSTGHGGMHVVNTATGATQRISAFPTLNPGSHWLGLLALSIAKPGSDCVFPGAVSWLSFDANAGSTAPGGQSGVGVTFDAADLAPGTYMADICVNSNDRSKPMLSVPIEFEVGDPDAIFADGFDPAAGN